MEYLKSKVYIQIDEKNRILRCEGGYTMSNIKNIEDWILIDEGIGDKYNLCQSHYFEGGLYNFEGIPLYKWENGAVVKRTDDEIKAEEEAIIPVEPEPTEAEQMRADIEYLAIMTGVEL